MKLPACAPPNGQPARTAPARGENARAEPRETRDAFERALRAKGLPLGLGDQEPANPEPSPPEGAAPAACAPLVRVGEAPAPRPAAIDTATGTRAAIETALRNAEPPRHPLAAAERPAVWEASVGGPHGSVEVRAERIVAHGAPPSWGLTVGAPALGADIAARHAFRLHERLRKQGIEVDHVRVQGEQGRDDLPS